MAPIFSPTTYANLLVAILLRITAFPSRFALFPIAFYNSYPFTARINFTLQINFAIPIANRNESRASLAFASVLRVLLLNLLRACYIRMFRILLSPPVYPVVPFLRVSCKTFLRVYFARMRAILLRTVLGAERLARCFFLKTHVQCEIYERDLSSPSFSTFPFPYSKYSLLSRHASIREIRHCA